MCEAVVEPGRTYSVSKSGWILFLCPHTYAGSPSRSLNVCRFPHKAALSPRPPTGSDAASFSSCTCAPSHLPLQAHTGKLSGENGWGEPSLPSCDDPGHRDLSVTRRAREFAVQSLLSWWPGRCEGLARPGPGVVTTPVLAACLFVSDCLVPTGFLLINYFFRSGYIYRAPRIVNRARVYPTPTVPSCYCLKESLLTHCH